MSPLNRRRFLKSSALATSALMAAPAIGRAGVSANDKMGVAIIGSMAAV